MFANIYFVFWIPDGPWPPGGMRAERRRPPPPPPPAATAACRRAMSWGVCRLQLCAAMYAWLKFLSHWHRTRENDTLTQKQFWGQQLDTSCLRFFFISLNCVWLLFLFYTHDKLILTSFCVCPNWNQFQICSNDFSASEIFRGFAKLIYRRVRDQNSRNWHTSAEISRSNQEANVLKGKPQLTHRTSPLSFLPLPPSRLPSKSNNQSLCQQFFIYLKLPKIFIICWNLGWNR